MRLLNLLLFLTMIGGAAAAQSNSELPLGANNCAIAKALNISLPIQCIDPPLGQKRGIVIRMDNQVRSPATTQNLTVSTSTVTSPKKTVAKTKPKKILFSHQAAKSENGYYIHFALSSFELEADYKEHLDRLATVLSAQAMTKTCLRITGHTDTSGGTDYNQKLSQNRAIMVGTYLAETGKIDPTRVQIAALGETQPLPELKGHDPRNRRVEFSTKESETGCK